MIDKDKLKADIEKINNVLLDDKLDIVTVYCDKNVSQISNALAQVGIFKTLLLIAGNRQEEHCPNSFWKR